MRRLARKTFMRDTFFYLVVDCCWFFSYDIVVFISSILPHLLGVQGVTGFSRIGSMYRNYYLSCGAILSIGKTMSNSLANAVCSGALSISNWLHFKCAPSIAISKSIANVAFSIFNWMPPNWNWSNLINDTAFLWREREGGVILFQHAQIFSLKSGFAHSFSLASWWKFQISRMLSVSTLVERKCFLKLWMKQRVVVEPP